MNFIVNESATKLRGGYYTEPVIARFLAQWVMESRPRRLLEPGCGDGAFVKAVGEVGIGALETFVGFEIDEAEAAKASKRARELRLSGARVVHGDYLEWSLKQLMKGAQFDAVLGNPPYVRYQYLDEKSQQRAERLFDAHSLPFTRHTNAWVPFVIAAISQLAPGGRLGMVVPSELLHVLHAQSLRDYLLATCSRILVVDPQELWFEEALQGVVLLMAEKSVGDARPPQLAIHTVRGREFASEPPAAIAARADFTDASRLTGKWMSVLLTRPERQALEEVAVHREAHRFADVAQVDVGIVTGANKFFLVSDQVVADYGLEPWAHPMFGRSEHVRGVIYDLASHRENRKLGLPTNFLDFGKVALSKLPAKVRKYIEEGEADALHTRYKCRIRTPWYSVPSVWTAPIGMLKRSHDFPRLVLNHAKALTTDTAYRIQPVGDTDPASLVYCFVNSATMLSAELEGRHYGGGVLELVPSEIEKLIIALPQGPWMDVRALDKRFRSGEAFEDILRGQDDVVLDALGIGRAARDRIQGAWDKLRKRRQRDSGGVESAAA
jgi:adenine-specific DNA methylase